ATGFLSPPQAPNMKTTVANPKIIFRIFIIFPPINALSIYPKFCLMAYLSLCIKVTTDFLIRYNHHKDYLRDLDLNRMFYFFQIYLTYCMRSTDIIYCYDHFSEDIHI